MPERSIYGVACKTKSEEEEKWLVKYVTHMYAAAGCRIHFEDGSSALGSAFVQHADESLLREGTFDLEAWQ